MRKDGEVVVTGKDCEAIEAAVEAIYSLIEELKTTELYQEKFSVPALIISFIVGKDGLNKKRIESIYNVHTFVPLADDESDEIIVKGSDAKNVSAAKQHILEKLSGTNFDLDDSFVRMIIGPEGETVRRLENEFNVAIRIGEKNQNETGRRKVYIIGEKGCAKAAKDGIISFITGRKKV